MEAQLSLTFAKERTFADIAGRYHLKSPYHKSFKKLPFNIDRCGYVQTVEYKGWQAYMRSGYYPLESLLNMIDTGVIRTGAANFPSNMKNDRE